VAVAPVVALLEASRLASVAAREDPAVPRAVLSVAVLRAAAVRAAQVVRADLRQALREAPAVAAPLVALEVSAHRTFR
jgi:hypothetical protein